MRKVVKFDEFLSNTHLDSELNESVNQDISYEDKVDMISLSERTTNIKDVIIWIGKDNARVSNIPRSANGKNCFKIEFPSFKISGYVDKSFITDEKIENIIKFLKINMETINKYFDNQFCTGKFIDKLKIK